jgi:hypothetical protein
MSHASFALGGDQVKEGMFMYWEVGWIYEDIDTCSKGLAPLLVLSQRPIT